MDAERHLLELVSNGATPHERLAALVDLGKHPSAFFRPDFEMLTDTVDPDGNTVHRFNGMDYNRNVDLLWSTLAHLGYRQQTRYLEPENTVPDETSTRKAWLASADMQRLQNYFTFLDRGERFADGLQAIHIHDGSIFVAMRRFADLAAPP